MNKKNLFVASLFLVCGTTFASRWNFRFEELGTVAIHPVTALERVDFFDMEVSKYDEQLANAKATFSVDNIFIKGECVLVHSYDCSYVRGKIWAPVEGFSDLYLVSFGELGACRVCSSDIGKQRV